MAHPEQKAFAVGVKNKFPSFFTGKRVLDVGSRDVNGSFRELFTDCDYTGIDITEGKDVDVVCVGHEYDADPFDVVCSGECFEHDEYWDKTLQNMVRLLKPAGLMFFTCATTGRAPHGLGKWATSDNYYRNITEGDVKEALDVSDIFCDWEFTTNTSSHDLYFYGVKK